MHTKHEYVDNEKLYQALIEYNKHKLVCANIKVPEYVGKCILLINQQLASRGNFSNYSYREEMVSDGIENCLAAVDNFDTEKYSKPFAYFTQIAWFAFLRRIDKEKKQNYLKYKNYKKRIAEEELTNLNVGYNPATLASDDVMDDFIKNYEENIERKKKKKKKEQGVERFIAED
jgi:DNA-directed RNA polymerase specialized sigma24 family protein